MQNSSQIVGVCIEPFVISGRANVARILRPPVDGMIVRGEHGLDVGEKVNLKLLSANTSNGFIDFAARK